MGDPGAAWPALLLAQGDTGWLQLDIPELPPIFGILAIVVLVMLNGFFVATEFALVAVRRSRIEQLAEEGSRSAARVKSALEHLDTYIAATQLGITMASLALGWIGEPALAHLIDPLLEAVLPRDWAVAGSHAIAVALSFAAITSLHIVLGELAPKGIALQRPEATALIVAGPTTIFLRVFRPFITLLNGVGNGVLRLFGFHPASGEEAVHTAEELRYILRTSREAGVLETEEEHMASQAVSFGDVTAREVMVPRTEMVAVPVGVSRDDFLALAGLEHHMRFPVYGDNIDDIQGVAYVTDALDWPRARPGETWTAAAAARKPLLVPESLKADRLLAQMRAARTHTAIAVDEFGGVSGMVVLQDLLEHIVGAVPELDEESEPHIEVQSDGSIRVDGMTPLPLFAERFSLDPGVDADTVGGYVLEKLGRVPSVGDEMPLDSYSLKVVEMDGPRVAEVVLEKST